jgi:microcin C transport system substrate-binding protein
VNLTRRAFVGAAGLIALAPPAARSETAALSVGPEQSRWRHGLALFGDLKYQPGFHHFGYVNVGAPKTGTVRRAAFGTYDNFNVAIAGLKGQLVAGIDLIYESLLVPSLDEPSSAYGLLASAVSHPPDFSSATYRLRPEAKWHDGRSVAPEDVVFSFNAFKVNNPRAAAYFRHVTHAEQTGENEITFIFDSAGNRELPRIVGSLTILPEHWWQPNGTDRHSRYVTDTTLEAPLGSGPYRIMAFEAGRFIHYERVADYWGRHLNVRLGHNNFDQLRFDYFRDLTIAFEAFKADQLDWHQENTAKNWATGYDFPAARDKRVRLEEFPIRSLGIMQAFAFNIRRSKFRDPRVRRAFNFAFNFEEVNYEMFFGEYKRIASYFEGTELACSGLPQGRERELLESLKGKVPHEVFTTPYWNPVGGNPAKARHNVLSATRLLAQAGFEVRDMMLVDGKTGEPLAVEFLLSDPAVERFVLFYKPSLERLGIQVAVRVVDAIQYVNRLRQWDFDIIVSSWSETLSPGNEQRDYWGSRAAETPGSQNLIGIRDAAIDALVDLIVFARDRRELVAATRALDRVLLWNHFVVPQWTYPNERTARWDRFARPKSMPAYGASAFPAIWWWDDRRANETISQQ